MQLADGSYTSAGVAGLGNSGVQSFGVLNQPFENTSMSTFNGGSVTNADTSDADNEFLIYNGTSTRGRFDADITKLAVNQRLAAFSSSFQVFLSSGGATGGGDGVSFNFGLASTLPTNGNRNYENGYATGLVVKFNHYYNQFVSIRWNDVELAVAWDTSTPAAPPYGTKFNATVDVSTTGEVTVKVGGNTLLTATIPSSSWQTTNMDNWQFGLAGRTGANTGSAWVDNLVVTPVLAMNAATVGADTLIGTDSADTITATGGGADKVLAGEGDDTIIIDSAESSALANVTNTSMLIDGGSGVNNLSFSNAGSTLDLTDPTSFSRLRNISSFDLTGTGNNTLNVNYKAVSSLSGATDNAATVGVDESKMLVVNGNAGDTVNVANLDAWAVGVSQSGDSLSATYGSAYKFLSGHTYKALTLNGATLFVDSTVTVNTTTTTNGVISDSVTVSSLFSASFMDVDTGQTLKGMAITSAGSSADLLGKGKYQISVDGVTWSDLAADLTDATAVYAAPIALIRYVGVAGQEVLNPQNLTVRLIDSSGLTGTSGTLTTGSTIDAHSYGDTNAFSGNVVTLQATANAAPVLADTVLSFSNLVQAATPATPSGAEGTLVADLTGGVTDTNTNAVKGIAIIGADTTNGTLYYSTNGGTTWTAVDTSTALSDSHAFLLKADVDNRLYFKPNANYSGANNALTFRAWDQTTGTEGTFVDIGAASARGGNTAFSTATDTVNQNVAPVLLDLNRDGVISYTHTIMDINSDGRLDVTRWAAAQDGVLVWDKFADGLVHDNSQYAFAQYGGATDLQGLAAAFDSNHDGVLDVNDAKFAEFKVWQDVNQDGISEVGEVRSLADWGITDINLSSDGVQRTPTAGVYEAGHSAATTADGSSMLVEAARDI